jgi:Calcineurin-like phosphoesterase
MRGLLAILAILGVSGFWHEAPSAQEPSASGTVRPIDPARVVLPPERASALVTTFSFIAYGDTRGQADGQELQLEHQRIVGAMIDAIRERASGAFPVRFIVQSGDAVTAGSVAAQWNVSFTPLIERLLRDGRVPYFFAVGNHDVTGRPVEDPQRRPGLTNTLAAMSRLYPPEGSLRRLKGYPTFAFGYGHVFVLAIDSNIADDPTQLDWVRSQLERLDRRRYRLVIALFHHPPFSSGPHGGQIVEAPTGSMRRLYLPLFRQHHVRMTIAGHEHLYEHWVERYSDAAGSHRIDHVVSGGGGAPTYTYQGDPDVSEYLAAARPLEVSLERVVKPGTAIADNPHHFVVVRVDGDRLSLEVIGTGPPGYGPYGDSPRVILVDRAN